MDFAASWAVTENMLLAATAEGLGSVVHFPVNREPEQIAEMVGAKDGYYLASLVMLGFSSPQAETPGQVEATVEKKVHWNKW